MNSRRHDEHIPLVTVLMPVHNDRKFAIEAARSILAQTLDDLELLVVDAGSDDGSGAALRELGDRRVRVITLAQNVGITAALNCGLDSAAGT